MRSLHFSTGALALALAFVRVKVLAAAPLTIHERFLSHQEIGQVLGSIVLDNVSADTYYVPAVLPNSIASRLRDLGGTCGALQAPGDSDSHHAVGVGEAVMTQLITATTDRHRDCYVPQAKGRVVEDDVAFIFLTSDLSAAFVHGEGPEHFSSVKAEAGTLVRFRGDVLHRTVVPSGSSVQIAGPFQLRTLDYVGSCPEECDSDADCKGGAFFSHCICPERRLERGLRNQASKERAMDKLSELSSRQGFLRQVARAAPRELQDDEDDVCTCSEATGACCTENGEGCVDVTVSQCRALVGVFQGGRTSCEVDGCNPAIGFGGCCFFDLRACMETQLLFCEAMTPGYFLGDGMSCDDCPPTKEAYGACCFMDSCKHLPEDECINVRGVKWMGSLTSCENDCHGACCMADGCEVITDTAKDTCSGEFRGAGTTCMPEGCPAKCESTFAGAPTIDFPAPSETETVSGDSSNGANYKENFNDCGAAILPSKGLFYNLPASDQSDRKVTASTCGIDVSGASAGYDTALTVYQNGCNDLDCVGANSDSDTVGCNGASTISWCAEKGKDYRILVHGFADLCANAAGKFTLAVRDDGPCDGEATTTTTLDFGEIPTPPATTTTPTATTTTTRGSEETSTPATTTTKISPTTTTTVTTTLGPGEIPTATTTTTMTPYTTQGTTTKSKPYPTQGTTTKSHPVIGPCEKVLPPGCPSPCYKGISHFDAYQPFCPEMEELYDPIKYIHCHNYGGCFVKECCDEYTYWNDHVKACDHIPKKPHHKPPVYPKPPPPSKPHPTLGTCKTALPPHCRNPCYPGISGFEAYQPFCPNSGLYDPTNYVLCDFHGGCFVKECCEPDTYWNDEAKACDHIPKHPHKPWDVPFPSPHVGHSPYPRPCWTDADCGYGYCCSSHGWCGSGKGYCH